MMASSLLTCFVVLISAVVSSAYFTCKELIYGDFYTYRQCANGCCGSIYDGTCCSGGSGSSYNYGYSYTSWSTAPIIGLVIGIIVTIAIVVGSIIACVCCCRKSPGHRGQVMRSAQPQVMVTTAGTTNAAYYPGPMVQPQPYPAGVASPLPSAAYPPSAPSFAAPPPPYEPVPNNPTAEAKTF